MKLRSALDDEIFKRQESIQLTQRVLREVERLQVDLDAYRHLYKLAHFSEPNAVMVSSMSCPVDTSPRVDLRRSNMSLPHGPQAPVAGACGKSREMFPFSKSLQNTSKRSPDGGRGEGRETDDKFTPRTASPTKQEKENSSKQAAANTESVSAAQGKWGKSTEEQALGDPDGSYSDYSDSSMDETEKLEAWKRTRTHI